MANAVHRRISHMTTAFSFIRWSRPEQGKGDTLRRQKDASAVLCKRNGWMLTELPPLQGRSAFRGKQRTTGPLAEFLTMAKEGRVKKGSVLIVESLDRLTREDIDTALEFFIGIRKAGITIATTSPEYIFRYDDSRARMQDIMLAVVILCRGNEESTLKSERIGQAWQEKRAAAIQSHRAEAAKRKPGTKKTEQAATKAPKMTAMCPAWLKLNEDRLSFSIIDAKADTVRLIFRLAADGYGVFRIARKLNTEKVPTLGNKPKKSANQWYESYIIRILNNRAVLGEFQPCTRDGNKSIPQGDPIPQYYPPIISKTDFVAARRAIDSRALGFKRTGKDIPNIFGRLIRNARDGYGFLYIPAKKKAPHPRLEPVGGRNGASLPLSCRYQLLEEAFIKFLAEITINDLTGNLKLSKAGELEWRIADLSKRIDTLTARMDTDPDLGSLLDKLTAWKTERKKLEKELETENNPTDEGAALADTKGIIKLLATDPEHYRTRLKQQIHLLVAEMWLLVFEYKTSGSRNREMTTRAAVLQVHFKAGNYRSIWVDYSKEIESFALDDKHMLKDLRTFRDNPWDIVTVYRDRWQHGKP